MSPSTVIRRATLRATYAYAALVLTLSSANASAQTPGFAPGDARTLLDNYCVTCHNARQKTAGLVLDKNTVDVDNVPANAEIWEKVVRKLRAQSMPPAGLPRPERALTDRFVGWTEQTIDRAAQASPDPGRPQVHRLNRTEYTNAIRDLLALEIDGRQMLPADNSGFGFDNIADVLTVSPGLLERYMLAAQKISRLAVGDASIRPVVQTYKIPFALLQEERMNEDLPFGSRGGTTVRHTFPVDGEYALRIRFQIPAMGGGVRGDARSNAVDVWLDGEHVKRFQLDKQTGPGGQYQPSTKLMEGLEVRFASKAGLRLLAVTFPQSTWAAEGVGPSHLPASSYGYAHAQNTSVGFGRIEMAVDALDVVGPFGANAPERTASRDRVFVCRPATRAAEAACARRIVSTLARRAYRRPLTEADVTSLLSFYTQGRAQGGFDTGIQWAVERVLVSPDFLFRAEREPAGVKPRTAYAVSDVELASRLSFFLWSSIPDDELLNAAVSGRLRTPANLEKQVRRMLADPRSSAFVDNFFGQWLWLRNVTASTPDPKVFQEFDDNLRDAFQRETSMFLRSQVAGDRPVVDLLTADYTFVNERLARHYGIPGVYGSHFRRITYADDRRAGILGQGGLLMVTSYAHRTSPVVRGKWLLENLLGTPPPPPPANVPPLPETDGKTEPKSVRERMEQHRKNPVCASCHSQLDPLGFALENFDGIGQWRTVDGNVRIDPSGQFPNGMKFSGPADFRGALVKNKDAFLTTAATKLLTYALGRGVEVPDMPAVRAVLRQASAHEYRWSALVTAIVQSTPFQMRRSRS